MSDGFEIAFSDDWTTMHQRLSLFSDKVAKQITVGALKETARIMRDSAKEKVAVSSEVHKLKVKGDYVSITPSNLKREIRFRKMRERNLEPGTLQYQVYVRIRSAWYAKFVEFGRSNMAAQPFMRPTFEQHAAQLPRIFTKKIDQLIRQGGF